jgi:hypothetical protein
MTRSEHAVSGDAEDIAAKLQRSKDIDAAYDTT